MNINILKQYIKDKKIRCSGHNTLPLTIYNYTIGTEVIQCYEKENRIIK